MPLHARTAPAHALRTVEAALSSPPTPTPAQGPETAPPRVAAALPLHLLSGVNDLTPRAPLTGWRFLLADGDRAVGAVDCAPGADGWSLSPLSEGPYTASALRCLETTRTLAAPYEPRLLCVPELYMMALWLRCSGPSADEESLGAADLLVPLAPSPPGITAERPHRVDGLLPLLTHRLCPAPRALMRTA